MALLIGSQISTFPKSTAVHGPTGILWPGISNLEQEDNVGCRAEEGV